MLNIGDKIRYKTDFVDYTGFILTLKFAGEGARRVRMCIIDNCERAVGMIGFHVPYDNVSVGEDVSVDIEGYQETFTITKLDDGEEFYNNYARIGTKIIANDCLGRFDRQPLIITGYAYSDADSGIYYVASLEDIQMAERMDAASKFYIKPRHVTCIDGSYITPRLPEYMICPRCNHEFEYYDGEIMCPTCIKREYVTPYHRFAPPIQFFSLKNANAKKYFGVELEVELGGENDSTAGEIVRLMRRKDDSLFAYVSHDGSLNSGLEIITQPATIGYHRSLEGEYSNLFRKLVRDGYRGHNCQNAGIHVHVNRDYFGDTEDEQEIGIAHLLLIVEKFWDEIKIFSRRDYDKSSRYTRKVLSDDYDNDHRWDSYDSIGNYLGRYNKTGDHNAHYYAVNVANPNTVELRMFRSTLNVNTFMCILEFVNSLVEAAKNKTTQDIFDMTFNELLNQRTREYYNSRLELRKFEEV